MPTINQLIRIERTAVVKRKKTPALQACPQRRELGEVGGLAQYP